MYMLLKDNAFKLSILFILLEKVKKINYCFQSLEHLIFYLIILYI